MMLNQPSTPFVETEILVVIMAADYERAKELIRELDFVERQSLEHDLQKASSLIDEVNREEYGN